LKKKFPGMTEYFAAKTKRINKEAMLIYNRKLAVSPLTTHLPLKNVVKNISKKKIVIQAKIIDQFYKKYLRKKPKIAVAALNPHCETLNKFSEESNILSPAIRKLKKDGVKIYGPYAADTLFLKNNLMFYDVIIGMYHDQVLTPIKTLYGFNAINITLGLPFIRITPDHGPNNQMIGKNLSSPASLIEAVNFIKKIK
jgi:4-hydroxythreonine-4-phosphate dehydrogenase